MPLSRYVYLLLFLSLLATGCESNPTQPDIPTIEETDFASSLNVDLSSMTETSSGLYYRDLEDGSGIEAKAGDEVSVRYTGWLANGTQIDSNIERDEPHSFQIDREEVIPGFDEGVQGMQVGGTRQLIIPPSLGYGGQPVGQIPAYSILVFEVELVDVDEDDGSADNE